MFRYEVGAHILIRKADEPERGPIEVKILAKAPNMIKAEIISDGWFRVGETRWLHSDNWFSVSRAR